MSNYVRLRDSQLYVVLGIACILAGCDGESFTTSTPANPSTPAKVAANSTQPAASATQPPTLLTTPPQAALVTPSRPAPVVTDSAPQITGAAATTAKVGQKYSFQPSAKDAKNAVLTFAISRAPKWATFNSATGLLTGTPTSVDMGINKAIVLQASNGKATASLAPFTITVLAADSSGSNVSLSWRPPTANTDGSALVDLSGYVIHYGSVSRSYTSTITVSDPRLTHYIVENLPSGTYYFSLTAITTSGLESSISAEVSTTIS